MISKLWLIATLFFTLLQFTQNTWAQNTARIAYISTQPEAVVKTRIKSIELEIERRWPKASSPPPKLLFDYYAFDLSTNSMRPAAETLEKNRGTLEKVIQSKPRIIYAAGADAAMLAKEMTSTIPIVLGCKCNPGPSSVRRLVLNMCAPEANLTGFTRYDVRVIAPGTTSACDANISPKSVALDNLFGIRLEILLSTSEKKIARVGLFYGEDYDEAKWQYVAKANAVSVVLVPIRLTPQTISDIPDLFERNRLDAALVMADTFLDKYTSKLISATSSVAKPTLFPWDEADAGAWMHYGTKVDLAANAADYFIALLQGRAVKDLPISFPTEYELVVNYTLAKKHGWVFPRRFSLYPQRETSF